MNTYPDFPSRLHWSAHALADAVPLRLFELYRFDADDGTSGNAGRFGRPMASRELRGSYVRPAPLPTRFSVHH